MLNKQKFRLLRNVVISTFLVVALAHVFLPSQVYAENPATVQDGLDWLFSVEGTFYDQDGVHGSQCIDLVRGFYIAMGAQPVAGNARDYITNHVPYPFVRYARNEIPNGVIKPGDVFIRADLRNNGHVGVVIYASEARIITMEANFGIPANTATQNNNPVQRVNRGTKAQFMDYIWGIIRPEPTAPSQDRRDELLGDWTGVFHNELGIGGMRLSIFKSGIDYFAIITYVPVEGMNPRQAASGRSFGYVEFNEVTGEFNIIDRGWIESPPGGAWTLATWTGIISGETFSGYWVDTANSVDSFSVSRAEAQQAIHGHPLESFVGTWVGIYYTHLGFGGMELSVFRVGEEHKAIIQYVYKEGMSALYPITGLSAANVRFNDATGEFIVEDTGWIESPPGGGVWTLATWTGTVSDDTFSGTWIDCINIAGYFTLSRRS